MRLINNINYCRLTLDSAILMSKLVLKTNNYDHGSIWMTHMWTFLSCRLARAIFDAARCVYFVRHCHFGSVNFWTNPDTIDTASFEYLLRHLIDMVHSTTTRPTATTNSKTWWPMDHVESSLIVVTWNLFDPRFRPPWSKLKMVKTSNG